MSKTYLIHNLPTSSYNNQIQYGGSADESDQLTELLGTSGSQDLLQSNVDSTIEPKEAENIENTINKQPSVEGDPPNEQSMEGDSPDEQQSVDNSRDSDDKTEEKEVGDIIENESAMKKDLVIALFHTICRSQTPTWMSNPGVFLILFFYGMFYLVLINNDDMILSSSWGLGMFLIAIGKIMFGFMRRGYQKKGSKYVKSIETKLRASFTMIISGYVASFFLTYWIITPVDNSKTQCSNSNIQQIRSFSIFMCLVLLYVANRIERHYNRHTSGEITFGLIIGIILGLLTFIWYSSQLNPPFNNFSKKLTELSE